jgi:hypothetical protein
MRAFPPDATSWAPVPDRRHADTDLYSSRECDPPTPLQMFTRLGVLLLITRLWTGRTIFGQHAPLTGPFNQGPTSQSRRRRRL